MGARSRVGDAAVAIGGVASLCSFPALPWPLRNIPLDDQHSA